MGCFLVGTYLHERGQLPLTVSSSGKHHLDVGLPEPTKEQAPQTEETHLRGLRDLTL